MEEKLCCFMKLYSLRGIRYLVYRKLNYFFTDARVSGTKEKENNNLAVALRDALI